MYDKNLSKTKQEIIESSDNFDTIEALKRKIIELLKRGNGAGEILFDEMMLLGVNEKGKTPIDHKIVCVGNLKSCSKLFNVNISCPNDFSFLSNKPEKSTREKELETDA